MCFILTQHTTVQDPSIKSMAEQVAQDPAFAQMSAALQASMAGGAEAGLGASGGATPPIDPDQYAQAMSSVLQNPQFMDMAEKLGQQIMQVGGPSFFSGRARTKYSSSFPLCLVQELFCACCHFPLLVIVLQGLHPAAAQFAFLCVQQDPGMAGLIQNMHNQSYRNNIGGKVDELKRDPEIAPILEEIEKGGPAAMMKCAPVLPPVPGLFGHD